MTRTDKSILWQANKARGGNAEALFLCHAEEITGTAVCGALEQAAHQEGDFLMSDGTVIEVKADSNGTYLETGNVCVQVSNDSGTGVGLLRKIKPDADSLHPALQQLYRDGLQHGKAPKNLYSVPEYTHELFSEVEAALEQATHTSTIVQRVCMALV